jgi:hypothetical protein
VPEFGTVIGGSGAVLGIITQKLFESEAFELTGKLP